SRTRRLTSAKQPSLDIRNEGSLFDADHPANGVPFPRRSTFLDIPDPIKPAERNWNVLLKTIKDGIDVKYPTSADKGPHTEGARIEGLYANLDSIRNPWRNATMHNENIYQIEEADHILKCVNVLFIKCAEMFDEQGEAI
ncbi:hypothetical protein, partial [Brevundimonas sp. TWP3-1-2b1]|uniref:hypothetical protein n=1 Tax=Brevundimonas sp. TWP3-1-2b1 TaxID=2804650 RepID=UPI003CFB325D